jgi:outer membrane lipoprotein-sorting protein
VQRLNLKASRRCMLVLTCLSMLIPCVQAESSLEKIQAQLSSPAVLKGEFEQRKTLQGFKNPLFSRGIFWVAKSRGVVWETQNPFPSSLIVTRERLLTRKADGTVATQIKAQDEPGIRAINDILFALMAVDWPTLSQRFTITATLQQANQWRMRLTPREASVAQWVSQIELQGSHYVHSVHITEPQGDTSLITFSAQTSASELTVQEAARFDPTSITVKN